MKPYYIVHFNYGRTIGRVYHLVRCPNGDGKLFSKPSDLYSFLKNRRWRKAI